MIKKLFWKHSVSFPSIFYKRWRWHTAKYAREKHLKSFQKVVKTTPEGTSDWEKGKPLDKWLVQVSKFWDAT